MKTYLEIGETYIEVDLDSPWFAFAEDEQRRHQTWSNAAQLFAWLGLSAVLVLLLVFSFFYAVEAKTFETCVSSQTVTVGEEPVVNEMVCR